MELSHLKYHKFKHNFQDSLDPLCSCGSNIEDNAHFLLHCQNFFIPRQNLLNKIRAINDKVLSQSNDNITRTLLYGNPNLNIDLNYLILSASIEFILSLKRFNGPSF